MAFLISNTKQTSTHEIRDAGNYLSALKWGSTKNYKFTYKSIFEGKDNTFILKHPVPCYFYYEGDELMGECPIFNFMSTGKTREEILEHFDMEFDFLYNNYFLEENSNLTKDAIALKKLIGNIIDKVN